MRNGSPGSTGSSPARYGEETSSRLSIRRAGGIAPPSRSDARSAAKGPSPSPETRWSAAGCVKTKGLSGETSAPPRTIRRSGRRSFRRAATHSVRSTFQRYVVNPTSAGSSARIAERGRGRRGGSPRAPGGCADRRPRRGRGCARPWRGSPRRRACCRAPVRARAGGSAVARAGPRAAVPRHPFVTGCGDFASEPVS